MTILRENYDLCVNWSIYVKCKDMGKAKRDHFPLVEAIIGPPAVPFQYLNESPGEFRIIGYTNYPSAPIQTTINNVFAAAYGLASDWTIGGLGYLRTGKFERVYGLWSARKPWYRAPQLTEMLFEVEPGLAVSMNEHSGVLIRKSDREDGAESLSFSPKV